MVLEPRVLIFLMHMYIVFKDDKIYRGSNITVFIKLVGEKEIKCEFCRVFYPLFLATSSIMSSIKSVM